MSSDTRCGAFEKKEWFWGKGVVDPVEFSDRRGVRFQEAVQCQFVVEPGKKLCVRHEFLAIQADARKLVKRK